MNHYQCVKCYIPRTQALIDADIVEFIPYSITFLSVTLQNFLAQAATDIVLLLTNPPKSIVPSLQAGDSICNAILEIAKVLKRADKITNLQDISTAPLSRVIKIN